MEALQALVLTNAQLREMLMEAARQGAAMAVKELRAEIHQAPENANLLKLRAYLSDPACLSNPHEHWANNELIRRVAGGPNGKIRSSAWFMKFQRETGLRGCRSRPSPGYGRRREWSFSDIKLAWDTYYRHR